MRFDLFEWNFAFFGIEQITNLGVALENFDVLLAEHEEPLSSALGFFAGLDGGLCRVRAFEVLAAPFRVILQKPFNR